MAHVMHSANYLQQYGLARIIYLISMALLGVYVLKAWQYPVYDWLGLLAVACFLFESLIRGRFPAPPAGIVIASLLALVGGAITAFGTEDPLPNIFAAVTFAYVLGVWIPVGSAVLRDPVYLRLFFAAIATSILITTSAAALQLWGIHVPGTETQWGRMTGLTRHPNELGTFCSMGLPLVLFLTVTATTRLWRFVWTGSSFISGAGILLSGSLTGFLSAIVAGTTFFILSGKRLRRLLVPIAVLSAISGWLALQLLSRLGAQTLSARVAVLEKIGMAHSTLGLRLEGDKEALRYIVDHPLQGAGFNEVVANVSTTVHNGLLRGWYEGGLFVFTAIVISLACAWWELLQTHRLMRHPSVQRHKLAFNAVAASFFAFALTLTVSPILYQRSSWFPVIAIFALRAIVRKDALPRSSLEFT